MKSLLVLGTFMALIGCSKDLEIRQSPICIEMGANASFTTIPFKKDYTIQIPNGYTGDGLVLAENASFMIRKNLESQLYYYYWCATDCLMYFGENLTSPVPDTIIGFPGRPEEEMTKSAEFCLSGDVQAILYYSSHPGTSTYGKLYMKRGQDFKEGLLLKFDYAHIDEIESILGTIAKH